VSNLVSEARLVSKRRGGRAGPPAARVPGAPWALCAVTVTGLRGGVRVGRPFGARYLAPPQGAGPPVP
jgi:hypothetical protein